MIDFTAADVPDQSGKTIIVTGANTGLGFAAAKVLAERGARVLLACRNQTKAEDAMQRIAGDTVFLPLDQADIASVRRAAELAAQEPRIDVLLNNAGVMLPPLSRTVQGFELQFGVNHLGCFALTSLMLPKLAETSGSRVVVTASVAHKRGNLNWDDLNSEVRYNRTQRYADSKLANLLFMHELDRRLRKAGSPITAIACHPGVADTDLMRHTGPFQVLMPLVNRFLNSAEQGAWPSLHAAVGPVVPGGYYGPQALFEMRGKSGTARRTKRSLRDDYAQRLWDISIAMTGIDPGLPG